MRRLCEQRKLKLGYAVSHSVCTKKFPAGSVDLHSQICSMVLVYIAIAFTKIFFLKTFPIFNNYKQRTLILLGESIIETSELWGSIQCNH